MTSPFVTARLKWKANARSALVSVCMYLRMTYPRRRGTVSRIVVTVVVIIFKMCSVKFMFWALVIVAIVSIDRVYPIARRSSMISFKFQIFIVGPQKLYDDLFSLFFKHEIPKDLQHFQEPHWIYLIPIFVTVFVIILVLCVIFKNKTDLSKYVSIKLVIEFFEIK